MQNIVPQHVIVDTPYHSFFPERSFPLQTLCIFMADPTKEISCQSYNYYTNNVDDKNHHFFIIMINIIVEIMMIFIINVVVMIIIYNL